jgi:hypothetical protein
MFWGDAFVRKWEAIPYDELMVAWSEELAGYTPEELKRGLAACKNRNFPVSFPEFVNLCRPVITPEEALAEAVAQSQMRPLGRDKWSHPAIFWTYYALSWEFKNLPTRDLEKRWGPEFKRIMNQGKWEPIPEIKTELVSYTPEPEVRSTLGKKGFDELIKRWRVE